MNINNKRPVVPQTAQPPGRGPAEAGAATGMTATAAPTTGSPAETRHAPARNAFVRAAAKLFGKAVGKQRSLDTAKGVARDLGMSVSLANPRRGSAQAAAAHQDPTTQVDRLNAEMKQRLAALTSNGIEGDHDDRQPKASAIIKSVINTDPALQVKAEASFKAVAGELKSVLARQDFDDIRDNPFASITDKKIALAVSWNKTLPPDMIGPGPKGATIELGSQRQPKIEIDHTPIEIETLSVETSRTMDTAEFDRVYGQGSAPVKPSTSKL